MTWSQSHLARPGSERGLSGVGYRRGISRGVNHRVVGLAGRILNGGKNVFSLQEGVISKNFFGGSPARQEVQNVGNPETKTPNAGAASALAFFHRYSLQPFVAHKLEVYDGSGQRARKGQPCVYEEPRTSHRQGPRYACSKDFFQSLHRQPRLAEN